MAICMSCEETSCSDRATVRVIFGNGEEMRTCADHEPADVANATLVVARRIPIMEERWGWAGGDS